MDDKITRSKVDNVEEVRNNSSDVAKEHRTLNR